VTRTFPRLRLALGLLILLACNGAPPGNASVPPVASEGEVPDPTPDPAAEEQMGEPTTIERSADIQGHDGERVVVIGIYGQLDVRMRQKPPPQYKGHAAITMSDGNLVLLEPIWSDDSIRSEEERAGWDGKKVKVTGTLYVRGPEPPEPISTMVMPTLSPVEAVEAAD